MFRLTITLLLINTYYRSLGNPIVTQFSLDNSLKALENHCENPFLLSQIKNRSSECNLNVPPFNSKQMQCLIFYDMNTQLCDAFSNLKLVQQDDLTNTQANVIKVDLICNEIAKKWKFTNLTEIPLYKKTAEAVFSNQEHCRKVCEVSDVTSDDSNSFCKYYKWGSEILKIQTSTPEGQEKSTNSEVAAAVPELIANTDTKSVTALSAINNSVSTTKNNIVNTNYEVKGPNSSGTIITATNVEKSENDVSNPKKADQTSNADLSGIEINQKNVDNKPSKISAGEALNNIEHLDLSKKPNLTAKMENGKIDNFLLQEQPPKKDDVEKEDQTLNNQVKEVKDSIIDDIEDETDSEEEDRQDLQDDSEISIGKADIQKIEEDKIKENAKSNIPIITSYTVEKSQGDFISKIPQDEFPEDDDHFFSFFLTAVIIVILLYILYHNKSKFTKVILGLIVEGRQPGRRRNSRGHAYRRLDTLEQAMSTNAAAPPSKIIY